MGEIERDRVYRQFEPRSELLDAWFDEAFAEDESGKKKVSAGQGFGPHGLMAQARTALSFVPYLNRIFKPKPVEGHVHSDPLVTRHPKAFQVVVYVSKEVSDMWSAFFDYQIGREELQYTFKPNTFADGGADKTYNCVTFALEKGMEFCMNALARGARLNKEIEKLDTAERDLAQIHILYAELVKRIRVIKTERDGGLRGGLQGTMMKTSKEEEAEGTPI